MSHGRLDLLVCFISGIHGKAVLKVWSGPGNVFEMHILGPHPRPTESDDLNQFQILSRRWTEPTLWNPGESNCEFSHWRSPVTLICFSERSKVDTQMGLCRGRPGRGGIWGGKQKWKEHGTWHHLGIFIVTEHEQK